MVYEESSFQTGQVRVGECLREGLALVRGHYWLLVGMSLMALVFVSVPVVLYAPALCGLAWCGIKLHRGDEIRFDDFFRGFDHFNQGILVALLHMGVVLAVNMVLALPFLILMFGSVVGLGASTPAGGEPSAAGALGFFGLMVVAEVGWVLAMIPALAVVRVFLYFAYPLLVIRRLPAMAAVKLSCRAGKANFWPLLGLHLLISLDRKSVV